MDLESIESKVHLLTFTCGNEWTDASCEDKFHSWLAFSFLLQHDQLMMHPWPYHWSFALTAVVNNGTSLCNPELLPAPSPTISQSSWQPQLRPAAPATSLVLELLLTATTPSCYCRRGPGGASAGLAVASCASREVVGLAGFASFISLAPAAAPWLSGEPFGSPFFLSYVLWGTRNFILFVNYVLFIFWVVTRQTTYAYHDGLRAYYHIIVFAWLSSFLIWS
jgi:hypothetical protein